ncbi:MAG: hypothetical protein Q9225_003262 [Loekoesia sp. 1 TL-2023]
MDEEQFFTPDTLLNEDPFRSETSQRLFEAIDELRSCGANYEIGLPELVIVGDQSAGKSSLLQSLTDIPFPVADGFCTRFPTRIVSRRTPNEADITRISIEPDNFDLFKAFALKETPDERAKRLEAYANFAYRSSDVTAADFRDAVDRAKELMGITALVPVEDGMRTASSRNFASDVLKVEVSGPDRSYFSILDVPGVFQSLTKGLTEKEKIGVRDLVASYMEPKHSVMICVASGNNDLANQAAFDMASEHDPQLQRTIGVITKCDITQNKNQALALAQNEEKHLTHGWFVVRNRTLAELNANISSFERSSRETTFFDSDPWNRLPESRRGTHALKQYLADQLCRRIREIFPSILVTVRDREVSTKHQLDRLGPARKSLEEKRTYLTDLAQQLHSLNSQALGGRYHGLNKESLKLRRLVREANDTFTTKMIVHGHCVPFQDIPVSRDAKDEKNNDKAAFGSPSISATNKGGLFGSQGNSSGGGSGSGGLLASQKSSSGGVFGSLEAKPKVGPQVPTTKGIKFEAPILEEYPGFGYYYQNVCMMQPYKEFSVEELRLSDYLQGPSPPVNGLSDTGPFGSTAAGASASGTKLSPSFFSGFGQPSTGSGQLTGTATPAPQASLVPAPKKSNNIDISVTSWSRYSQIYSWIREEIRNCRGTELQGTLNPDVLPALFHRQIINWKTIATSHFQSVTDTTIKALEEAVNATCGDTATAQRIQTLVQRTNGISKEQGLSQLNQRFDEIVSRHLQTQNPSFEKNIRDARLARFEAALERYRSKRPSSVASEIEAPNEVIVNLLDVTSLFDELHMSNAQNLEDEIHDTLKSYYELALHDFIEFVTQQVVESYLNDPKGPVLFFNPLYIGSLTLEEIEDLGAEDAETARVRAEKEETLARLSRAEEIALKYTREKDDHTS